MCGFFFFFLHFSFFFFFRCDFLEHSDGAAGGLFIEEGHEHSMKAHGMKSIPQDIATSAKPDVSLSSVHAYWSCLVPRRQSPSLIMSGGLGRICIAPMSAGLSATPEPPRVLRGRRFIPASGPPTIERSPTIGR